LRKILIISSLLIALLIGIAGHARANNGQPVIKGSGVITSTITSFAIVGQQGSDAVYQATWKAPISGPVTGTCTSVESGLIAPDGSANVNGTAYCFATVNGQAGNIRLDFSTVEQAGNLTGTFTIEGLTGGLVGLHGHATFQGPGGQTGATLNYIARIHLGGDPSDD
jgi:hypothetical protein